MRAATPSTGTARWFAGLGNHSAGTELLLCLPPAGAGPSSFRDWPAYLPAALEMQVLALPGREARIGEPPEFTLDQVVDAVWQRADRPFAMYGHSLGGLLAFEVVRELRRRGGPMPRRLYLGAARPPHLPKTMAELADAPEAELLARIAAMGGLPDVVRANRELLDIFLPVLRADLRWLSRYAYRDGEPLPVPVVCLAGRGDVDAGPSQMREWARHTTEEFALHSIDGGHMFLQDRASEAAALVAADLPRPAGTGRPVPPSGSAGRSVPAEHLVPLGDGGWAVWREAVLRAAGFPAEDVLRLSAPELAAVADAHLDGAATEEQVVAALSTTVGATSEAIYDLAGEPRFREAVTWQNLNALVALDGVRRGGPDERSHDKRRAREQVIGRYWQRYAAKNDTIGFFGPICWIGISATDATTVTPGPALTRQRMVTFERRALSAFGDRIAADPVARRWLPAGLHVHLWRDGDRRVLRPAAPPVELSPAEAAVLDLLDGRCPVIEVAAELVAQEPKRGLGLRKVDDVYLMLDQLVERGLVWWGCDLPMDAGAEARLAELIEGIGDQAVRTVVAADFARLTAARDAVADAAGDPDRLRAALDLLHAEFVAVTGAPALHGAGETYAGRAVCYEDTVRDLDVELGASVLDGFAAPLGVLLQVARWLTVELADAYGAAFRGLYEELAAELGTAEVPFAELWYLAQGLLFGEGDRPVDAVSAELAERFAALAGLADVPAGTSVVRLRAADLAGRVVEVFPASRPGWSAGRIHSPDLQFCADSVAALTRGDCLAVLGELHAAWSTLDSGVFVSGHQAPDRLREWLATDLGPGRVRLLFPPSSPRLTARVGFRLHHHTDTRLGFLPAPGADARLVPITALRVRDVAGELVVHGPGRTPIPLVEMFSELLSMHASEAFKLVSTAAHTPRIMIDRLVVVRETWRTTVDECGLAGATGSLGRYLAVRRWRQRLGLPEQVYVKLSTEIKPFYVDLSSPLFASSLCAMARAARQRAGGGVALVVSEALPGPQQAWVPDAQGRRYQSELRVQVVDPAQPRTWGENK
ncbi:thioesterase domain-containing protein [Micromonospora eburnea]|uniref:Surfactin synthase thioesterase subunit n=1 Tax=Micromonospora eburnea TaxID=227316 RepID=A0A1C6UXS2_9ACTN|nr:thioesterase domain-containing protein [Micromonospora eburnea]SCL58863.1 Surfactin synthase thioesterase subunit [Micromonospora eburnea]